MSCGPSASSANQPYVAREYPPYGAPNSAGAGAMTTAAGPYATPTDAADGAPACGTRSDTSQDPAAPTAPASANETPVSATLPLAPEPAIMMPPNIAMATPTTVPRFGRCRDQLQANNATHT